LLCFALFFLYSGYNSRTLVQVSSASSDLIVRLVSFEQRTEQKPELKTATQFVKAAQKKVLKKLVAKEVVKPVPKKVVKPVAKKVVQQQKQKKVPVKKVVKPKVEEQKEVKYVTRKEFDAVMLEQALQEAIVQVWAPPAGMDSSLVCNVALTIDWDGKLLEAKVEESSGILVYDIAVEHAIDQLVLPRQLWGKTVRVAFKP
jgi:outer membrane biosynthesis protein TonB